MAGKIKLELTWIGKENRPRLEPRILLEDQSKSYHAAQRVSDSDLFDNRLIFGDNLLALKALEQEFTGKVKCVYIDPPYNTGSAFEHYDDSVEHSLWLSLLRDRLELLRRLLTPDGSIWLNIDDNEGHYCKVLMDEIFGRHNFRACITWQRKYSVSNNFKGLASICDYILVFSKSELFQNNLLPRSQDSIDRYANPDNDPRGPWKAVDYLNQATPQQRPNLCYPITNPKTGEIIRNSKKAWKYEPEAHSIHVAEKRLWWGRNGTNTVPALKLFLTDVRDGMTPHNWWPHEEVGHTDEAKKESNELFGGSSSFGTPKPERLLHRILALASNPGDIVLDSFAGSGTTGAVAQKMGRRWIMVELGEHCHTHIIPRMRKVIDGADPGGVTEAIGWKGGGGFRYYRLAPSLLEKDKFGNWVVSKQYNAVMLAEAMCKLEGFTYAPSSDVYWQHGHSTERDFIYVTTQTLTREMLAKLSDEVGEDRSLLICCGAFRAGTTEFPNLTLKKIPKAVMSRCEWGKDDYSLQIAALPKAPPVDDDDPPSTTPVPGEQRKQRKARVAEPSLFGNGGLNQVGGGAK
jgi:adenine-specific DNA-methyltransferase